jgi:hypothetical protein
MTTDSKTAWDSVLSVAQPKWNGLVFGTVFEGKRYIAGSGIQAGANVHPFEWRNELFERVDPLTLQLLPNAQRQPNPL